jgi:diacylglycerol kinase family enzyme
MVERCAALLKDEGCTVEMQDTLSAYSAGDQAREAVKSGFDTIFACGGDGTFFQVLQGVAGSDVTLGIIPFGTGNVLAQNLRLPRDPVAAMMAQRNGNGRAMSIPLGEITCGVSEEGPRARRDRRWYFTIAAGLGLHAALMDLAPNGQGKRLGGRAAYFAGGTRLLFDYPIQPFDVEVRRQNGATDTFRASELLGVRVAEINRWRPGGDLCSSHLRMAVVPETNRLGLAHAMVHAMTVPKTNGGGPGIFGLPRARYEDVTEIVCKPVKGFRYATPLLVEADGEVVGVEHATLSMAKKRVKLLWPG